MSRTIAEINADNEKFLSAIIGEATSNSPEVIPEEPTDTDTADIPDSDPSDPHVADVTIHLAYGEELVMSFKQSDWDYMMMDLEMYDKMINFLHHDVTEVYANGYTEEMEKRIIDYFDSLGLPADAYKNVKNNEERILLEIIDCISIYTTIGHMLHEKQLSDGIFAMLTRPVFEEENKNEDSETKD